jgi:hypothetical protein
LPARAFLQSQSQSHNKERKKEDNAASAALSDFGGIIIRPMPNVPLPADPMSPPQYAFEAGKIKLTAVHLEQWRKAYPNLSLEAEIHSLEPWASKQPEWFHAVRGALAKRNREVGLAKDKIHAEAAAKGSTPDDVKRRELLRSQFY